MSSHIRLGFLTTLVVAVSLGLDALSAQPTPPAPVPAVGAYQCSGTNLDGSPYAINLDIDGNGTVYSLTWKEPRVDIPVMVGFGVRRDDQLAVTVLSGPGVFITVLYTLSQGRVEGIWTDAVLSRERGLGISSKIGQETCRQGEPV